MRGRVGVGVLVVFGLLAAGCGGDAVPSDESPAPVVEAAVEDVATVDELASLDEGDAVDVVSLGPSELMGLGWVLGDDGLLHPPALEYEEGYAPEDQSAYFTFVNNSGYNLDLLVSVSNDEGSDQSTAEFNKESSIGMALSLDDDMSFGFVLMRAGSSTTYSFVGDRGGAPCEDRLSEIGPGSSWTVEFVPTDGGTFGFPGVLTSDDGVECTFGMLTGVQSFVTDHPVWTAVIVVVLATVVVATGFKLAKGRGLRAVSADGEVIAAAARAERLAPEIVAVTEEEMRVQREMLAELKQYAAFDSELAAFKARLAAGEIPRYDVPENLIREINPATGEMATFNQAEYGGIELKYATSPARKVEEGSMRFEKDLVTGEVQWYKPSKTVNGNVVKWEKMRNPYYTEKQLAEIAEGGEIMSPEEAILLNEQGHALELYQQLDTIYEARPEVLRDGITREWTQFISDRTRALRNLTGETKYVTEAEVFESSEAFINQQALPEIAARYRAADGELYETVMASIGDDVTLRALIDPTFDVIRWEEFYLAGRELVLEGAVLG